MTDLGPTRTISSRSDGPWAATADIALLIAAVEIAITRSAASAAPIIIALAYLLTGQASVFRFRVMSAAVEMRAGAGVLALSILLAALVRPAPWVAISVLGATGLAKLARETIVYVRLKRAMLAQGKVRRVSRKRLAVFSVFAGGSMAVLFSLAGEASPLAIAYAAWFAAYFAGSAAVELVA